MSLDLNAPIRMLNLSWPGGGKTGCLASLANAGFKLRILDFDGKMGRPLGRYVKPECRDNVDVFTVVDKLRGGTKFIEVSGIPTAFATGVKAMDSWEHDEVDLGSSKDWGPDTVVVLDTGTAMGRAAFRRMTAMNNRTKANTRDGDWGAAMSEEADFLEKLCSPYNAHHVIVNYHMKWLGPREERKGDTDAVKEIKAREADLIPTRLYPSAMGSKSAPQNIAQYFTETVQVKPKFGPGKRVARMIYTEPTPELDLKLAADITGPLPIESGMLTIFSALLGGLEECLGADAPTLAEEEEKPK